MNHTIVKTPGGEELVLMSRAEFERLGQSLDVAEHDRILGDIASGRQETLSAENVAAALAEPTPLAFWRKRRGLTQKAIADAAGISQPYLASLEAGKRKGDPALFLRLARALNLRMEDLVEG
ncbi:MAG: helix-turn-helix transcriptional regulator [Phyllobacteriaceae bacterium]|nr:helix-turn-helix transcriptional regulator [Phyllobacteriaceae bacterium]